MRSKRPRVVKLTLAVEPEIRLWVTSSALTPTPTPTVTEITQAQITQTRLSNNAAQVPKGVRVGAARPERVHYLIAVSAL